MNEIEHKDSQPTGPAAPGSVEGDTTVPLGAADFGTDEIVDPFAAESPKRKRRSGALVLILVVGLAVGGLISMHTLAKVTAGVDRDTDVERTIEDFLKALAGGPSSDPGGTVGNLVDKDRALLAVLNDDYSKQQVALSDVQRNPFIILEVRQVATNDNQVDPTAARLRQLRQRQAERREQIEKATGRLRLQSVIMGSNPLAIINDRIVRVGEVVTIAIPRTATYHQHELEFRVSSISSGSTTVVVEDAELDVTVETVLHLKQDHEW